MTTAANMLAHLLCLIGTVLDASADRDDAVTPPVVEAVDGRAFFDGERMWLVAGDDEGRLWLRTDTRATPVTLTDRAIVTCRSVACEQEREALAFVPLRCPMPQHGICLVESRSAEDGVDLAMRLSKAVGLGQLVSVFPDVHIGHVQMALSTPPNDPRFLGQYYLDAVHATEAWAVTSGRPEITIAVVDNGCDLSHPDLADKWVGQLDAVDGDGDPSPVASDAIYHGTACAGLAGASTNNGIDIAGACPDCTLACARLLPGDNENTPLSADVDVFGWVLENAFAVTSNSWGFIDPIPVPAPLRDALLALVNDGADGKGTAVLFAAGNDGRVVNDDELLAVDGIIGVGAVSNIGELTQYTNTGASIDVVAPTGSLALDLSGAAGDNIGDTLSTFSGTSSSTPIVAGVAGLLASLEPAPTARAIHDALLATAQQSALARPDDSGHDVGFGFGLVRADRALTSLREAESPDPADTDEKPPSGGCGATPLALPLLLLTLLRRKRR